MLETIIAGGPLMIVLMIESILAIAVALDRAAAFRANARVDIRSLRSKVQNQLLEAKYEEALAICLATPGPVSAVMPPVSNRTSNTARLLPNPDPARYCQ